MKKLLAKYNNYRKNHKWFNILSEHTVGVIVCITSAFIIALAMQAFVAPNTEMQFTSDTTVVYVANLPPLIAGGANGISQIFTKIAFMIAPSLSETILDVIKWVLYAVVNIPLIIIAWLKVGKKFAIYTLLNVLITSALSLLISEYTHFFEYIALNFEGMFLPRALIGGGLIGVSGGIAFRFGQSTGGMDIVGHILASKKSALTGRFSLMINVFIMLIFVTLSIFSPNESQRDAVQAIQSLIGLGSQPYEDIAFVAKFGFFIIIVFCSFAYLLTSALVMDLINLRNKKELIQIVTRNKGMADVLVHSFKHGVTSMVGRGEFTKEPKIVLIMTVSHYETADVVALVKENDPEAFVNVLNLRQVYGRFYIPPIK